MTARLLTAKQAERIGHVLSDACDKLRALRTIAFDPPDDGGEALGNLALAVIDSIGKPLDDCAGLVWGIRGGGFDTEPLDADGEPESPEAANG